MPTNYNIIAVNSYLNIISSTEIEGGVYDIVGRVPSLDIFYEFYPLFGEIGFPDVLDGVFEGSVVGNIINEDYMIIGVILHQQGLEDVCVPIVFGIIATINRHTERNFLLLILACGVLIDFVHFVQMFYLSEIEVMVFR